MNYEKKENKIVAKIGVVQSTIDHYKEIIENLEIKIPELEKEYDDNVKKSRQYSIQEEILGHDYYLISKYKKALEKSNKKLEKLFRRLNTITLKNR